MIITDDFLMLNFPKTGSSFARKTISTAYTNRASFTEKLFVKLGMRRPSLQELFCPHTYLDAVDQHGTFSQIPDQFRQKKLLSITRSPTERYLSMYHYRWWADNPPAAIPQILKSYPDFPNLSFNDYYEMQHSLSRERRLCGILPPIDIGDHTVNFIQLYFKNPNKVLSNIDNDYIFSGEFRKDIPDIHFIHQENLRFELKQFLLDQCRFKKSHLDFMDDSEIINASNKSSVANIDNEIKQKIYSRDALIYEIFPEYKDHNHSGFLV